MNSIDPKSYAGQRRHALAASRDVVVPAVRVIVHPGYRLRREDQILQFRYLLSPFHSLMVTHVENCITPWRCSGLLKDIVELLIVPPQQYTLVEGSI